MRPARTQGHSARALLGRPLLGPALRRAGDLLSARLGSPSLRPTGALPAGALWAAGTLLSGALLATGPLLRPGPRLAALLSGPLRPTGPALPRTLLRTLLRARTLAGPLLRPARPERCLTWALFRCARPVLWTALRRTGDLLGSGPLRPTGPALPRALLGSTPLRTGGSR
ncbi:hypothetical protein DFR74_110146 [Nocardia puris]|uniref:Uncharacterized protein n=1 Tax=Nocardia puris TaxID=208602 RepID=A0A366DCW1_9NOCA|nr:hypothetical protein DFR74_110146 [Nocardia puris]